jgi:hypothetical protein
MLLLSHVFPGLIILGIILDLGGGPDHDRIGFRFWKEPGPFVQYNGIAGAKGRFLGWWAVMTQAAFSFIGTEIVAVRAYLLHSRRCLPIYMHRSLLERRRTQGAIFPRQFVVCTFASYFSTLAALPSSVSSSPPMIRIWASVKIKGPRLHPPSLLRSSDRESRLFLVYAPATA